MIQRFIVTIAFFTVMIPALDAQAAKVSVLIDFDPKSADQTVIVESIAVDHKDRLDGIGASIIKIEP
jgi:DNA primase